MSAPTFSSPAARRDYVLQLRGEGVTFKGIAERLGISPSRARELYLKAERIRLKMPPLPIAELGMTSPVSRLPLKCRTINNLRCARFATLGQILAIGRAEMIHRYMDLSGDRAGLDEILALLDNLQGGGKAAADVKSNAAEGGSAVS
ncbi:hypothetical protein SAMN05428974_1289 [Sphingopyxis sp. YR583]|nr:hypothetical protein SAMN05428974_1289 [Sphingopyxis sp. YR583]